MKKSNEGGFVQGQPELQQAMDNRQPEDPSRKRQAPLTSGYLLNQGYPALFKRKTSDLLQEAETMLNRVKIFKERIWLQTFLYRLKSLERALEQTEYLYNAETYNDYNDFINSHFGKNWRQMAMLRPEFAIPAINASEVKVPAINAPAPAINAPAPALNAPAPAINASEVKVQKLAFEYPVASPALKQTVLGNDYPSNNLDEDESQLKGMEDDQLVRELQSLHKNKVESPSNPDQSTEAHSPSMKTPEEPRKYIQETEKEGFKSRISEDKLEKGILSTMLQHEVAQLQSKGKSQAEITKTLHLDNPHYASIINPSLNTQESNRRDINNFEAAEPNQANKAIQGVNDLKQDEKVIVGIKPDMSNSEEIQIYSKPPQPKVTYINNTYQHMLLNGPTADSKVQEIREPQNIPGNAAHEHHDAIQDSIAYLQKQDQPTYAIRSHVMQPPNNLGPNYPHFISYPYVEVPKGTLKPQRQQKQSNVLTPLPHYSEYIARGSYAPYPYLKLWDHKNATFLQSHLMTSIPYKSNSSHKIDAELSDDMKRQLRDGKIIVLSDSLVRKF
ncbi:uncharacterized protein LOC118181850 isoform X2 [Stegodyphus dumicola]|uniref:uncharacterized protein LOC118181850 isoform X2 n=1 Tax=Stegodyphus dumicola TaxID=202533 RepID=UPI0015ABF4AE|nr:uncharacterized protein LOC118181850 isoform X2 [Stegodyphus dumicola]